MEQVGKVEQAMFHLFPEKHPIYRGFTQKRNSGTTIS